MTLAIAPRLMLVTPRQPGAIAILQLVGQDMASLLSGLIGRSQWSPGQMYVVDLMSVDRGLAVLLRDEVAQIMPHGGLRVVQKLVDRLIDAGFVYDEQIDTRHLYPEADSEIEADVLACIAMASSPAAIDLLAGQPQRWRHFVQQQLITDPDLKKQVIEYSAAMDQLLYPPLVVVLGPANVGKSTLTNLMMRRSVSVVADLPGTTRDWVGGLAELGGVIDAIAVKWIDTPGFRSGGCDVEQQAIKLAAKVIHDADVIVAMLDPDHGIAQFDQMADVLLGRRKPDLWVMNKIDNGPGRGDGDDYTTPLTISAREERGIDMLQKMIIRKLGLEQINIDIPWVFSTTLKNYLSGTQPGIMQYLQQQIE